MARRPKWPSGRGRQLVVIVGVAAVAGLVGIGLARSSGDDQADPRAQAEQWLRDFGPGQVLTDDRTRVALTGSAGWRPDQVISTRTCADSRCQPDWILATPELRNESDVTGGAGGVLSDSTPVAVYGDGGGRVEVRHRGVEPVQDSDAELRARADLGSLLVGSGRVETDEPTRQLFIAGQVDPRILANIAGLISGGPVQVTGLPALPGEDAAGQPRRQLVLSSSPPKLAEFRGYFAAQQPPYRPQSVSMSPPELRVLYPPVAPSHLLQDLAGS